VSDYRILTYLSQQGPRAGVLIAESIYDAAALTSEAAYKDVLGILRDWPKAEAALNKVATDPSPAARLPAGTSILAPIPDARAIFCAGANYSDHIEEMRIVSGRDPEPDPRSVGLKPWHFIKSYHTLCGPDDEIKLPEFSEQLDWEAELAVIIGKSVRNVSADKALEYVAGYTVANDLSARDAGKRPQLSPSSPFFYDWVSHKSFEGACPLGPWIVPASAISDPQALDIKLWVNDELKQDSNTSQMIYGIAEQISHLSTRLTLQPGDIILTGTPAGVGSARREFLKRGDTIRVFIEGIGTLKNRLT